MQNHRSLVLTATVLAALFVTRAASAQSWEKGERKRESEVRGLIDAMDNYAHASEDYDRHGDHGDAEGKRLALRLGETESLVQELEGAFGLGFDMLAMENTTGETSVFTATPEYYLTAGPEAHFFLGNQAKYSVKLGPIELPFDGAMVEEFVKYLYPEEQGETCQKLVSMAAGSGWAHLYHPITFEEYDTVVLANPMDMFTTGFLAQDIVMASEASSCSGSSPYNAACGYVYRYRYFNPDGEQTLFLATSGETPLLSTWNDGGCGDLYVITPAPTQYQSVDRLMTLDVTNPCMPVIHFADGSTQELHEPVGGDQVGDGYFDWTPAIPDYSQTTTTCSNTGAVRHVDVNGNVTTYTYPTADTRAITDARGRQTTLTFNSASELTSVSTPGPGGVPEVYTINWTSTPIDFDTTFSEIQCYGTPPEPCGSTSAPVVSSVQLPDGRLYQFAYGLWGNLTQVTEPDGAVRTYAYGDSTNTAYGNASLALTSPVQTASNSCQEIDVWSGQEANIQARGLIGKTLYPQGTSSTGYTWTTNYTHTVVGQCGLDAAGAATGGTCCSQVWRNVTAPDGTVTNTGYCTVTAGSTAFGSGGGPGINAQKSGPPSIQGWELGEEIVPSGASSPIRASYYGSKATGVLYDAFDTATTYELEYGPAINRRRPIVTHLQDGLTTTSTVTFGDVLNGQNLVNATAQCLWAGAATSCTSGSGTKLIETDTVYFHNANYNARNILHLPSSSTTMNGSSTVLSRNAFSYDQFALGASGQPGLDTTYTNAYRGDLTTTTRYTNAAAGTGAVSSTSYYFDNGAVQKTQDPNDLGAGLFTTTLTAFNFGPCSSNPTLTSTVQNALSQSVSTVADCYSGATLSALDANGNRACTQYDGLGRVVETAAPGDTLTTQAQCTSAGAPTSCFVTDTANCATSGTAIGDNGKGPTTWTLYYPFGIGGVTYDQARTVTASRDGTTNGHQHVAFVDGLDRVVQQCSEVDPSFSTQSDGGVSGDSAVCSTTAYDNMGRASQQYVPFYPGTAMPTSVAAYPSGDQYTQTLYDGLGRITSVQLVGSRLPATTTAYSSVGSDWVTTVTDANGCEVQTKTDGLGHVVEHDVQNEAALNASGQCSGTPTWFATTMQYDVLGRLLTVTDPGSNQTTFQYDGLGRKTEMTDPDMGTWLYQYDGNGNLTQQTDARGAIIYMHYDALNRVTLKDLPYWEVSASKWKTGTPGEEDEVTYYDSSANLPSTCYSCDDHCSSTTDTCHASTLVCTHTGSTTGCPNQ